MAQLMFVPITHSCNVVQHRNLEYRLNILYVPNYKFVNNKNGLRQLINVCAYNLSMVRALQRSLMHRCNCKQERQPLVRNTGGSGYSFLIAICFKNISYLDFWRGVPQTHTVQISILCDSKRHKLKKIGIGMA